MAELDIKLDELHGGAGKGEVVVGSCEGAMSIKGWPSLAARNSLFMYRQ